MRALGRVLVSVIFVCLILLFSFAAIKIVAGAWRWGFGESHAKSRIVIVDITGGIWNVEPTLKRFKQIEEDKSIHAVVLRIDSPGGLVVPSHELYAAIRKLDDKVPVIVSTGIVAASGGYYAALGGRKIVANPSTVVGSIGVIMEFVNTQKLYQWAKIERYALKTGKFKDIGSPLREMTPEERQLLTGVAMDILSEFKRIVKERRGLSEAEVDKVSDGRVFTGKQALPLKLIDSIGTLDDAVAEAKLIAKVPDSTPVDHLKPHKSFIRELFEGDDDDGSESMLHLLHQLVQLGLGGPSAGMPALSGWQPMLILPGSFR